MNRQEIKIAIFMLALIGLAGVALKFGKMRLGQPGLIVESGTLTNEVGEIVRKERVRFPDPVDGFAAADGPITKWEIETLPKDTTFGRKMYWNDDGFGAQVTAVLMKSDRTSIHRPQTCVTGAGWKIDKTEVIQIPIAAPSAYELAATCMTLSKDIRAADGTVKPVRALYIYWFVSENRLAAAHPEALWHITLDLLSSGTLHPWAYVSVFSTCSPGNEQVLLARMKRLVAATTPSFQLTAGKPKQTAFLDESARVN